MLTLEENELLCRVGSGTKMGAMLRRYWIPALLTGEIEAGGAPKRVRLLGEDLVAFRDDAGNIGLLEESCPHRGASLAIARNEKCGLRCLYHGWKIDPTGSVLETPAEPDESSFRTRVRATAYPTHEAGGMVWAYLGPANEKPPIPDFAWTNAPSTHRTIFKAVTECNWIQALEGVVDSAHSNFLHSDTISAAPVAQTVSRGDLHLDRPSDDLRPRLEVESTPYGFRYAAIRKPIVKPDKNKYVRITVFVAPFYGMFPAPRGLDYMQIFVPIDDTHTMFYYVQLSHDAPFDDERRERCAYVCGLRAGLDIDDNFRRVRRRENDWMQSRPSMTGEGRSFSGIFGIQNQDMAVQESMGPIYDRRKEHLGTSDIAVIRLRRVLLDSIRDFAHGKPPIGLAEPMACSRLRADEGLVPIEDAWQSLGNRDLRPGGSPRR